MYEVSNIVESKPVGAADERTTELIDPCTGEVFATAPLSSNVDVEAAYGAARSAFQRWRRSTPAREWASTATSSPRQS